MSFGKPKSKRTRRHRLSVPESAENDPSLLAVLKVTSSWADFGSLGQSLWTGLKADQDLDKRRAAKGELRRSWGHELQGAVFRRKRGLRAFLHVVTDPLPLEQRTRFFGSLSLSSKP